MSAAGVDLDALHTSAVEGIDPREAELCARLVARYARTPDDGDLIADALGLDAGVRFWSEQQIIARIMRLADSIGARP